MMATRALAASEFGSADDSQLAIDALIKSQNEDGGWGWLADEASDPLATAQALYVLERSGRVAKRCNVYRPSLSSKNRLILHRLSKLFCSEILHTGNWRLNLALVPRQVLILGLALQFSDWFFEQD